jgi:hypothetical protein
VGSEPEHGHDQERQQHREDEAEALDGARLVELPVAVGRAGRTRRCSRGTAGRGGSISCESLAGRTADAVEHLSRAIDMWEGCRELAKEDSDFDPIRDEPAFQELVGR